MTILSDWNQNLHAYSIPESLIKSINNQGSDDQIIFDDSNCNPSSIRFYFGNIPNEKILSQYHNLEWIHFGSIGIDKLRQSTYYLLAVISLHLQSFSYLFAKLKSLFICFYYALC